MIADVLSPRDSIEATVPVDANLYAASMQPGVTQAVEAELRPLVKRLGGKLRRRQHASTQLVGPTGPLLYSTRWTMSRGARPGFVLSVHHDPHDARRLVLVARPTFPSALVVGLGTGALLEALWAPWISANFWPLLRFNAALPLLYLAGMLLTIALLYWAAYRAGSQLFDMSVVQVRLLALCVFAAVPFSFMWGLFGGLVLGWGLATHALAAGESGLREDLRGTLARAASAVASTQAPPILPRPPRGPTTAVPHGPVAHRCPTCRAAVMEWAAQCPICRGPLRWK
jgi:hypothetical protein